MGQVRFDAILKSLPVVQDPPGQMTAGSLFRSRQPLDWLTTVDAFDDGFDVPIGPRGNALGTTALTPPVLGDGGSIMTNTIEAPPPKLVDISASLARLDNLEAYRNAEMMGGQIAKALVQSMLDSVSNSWIMHRARALEAADVHVDADKRWERLDTLERQWTPEVHFLLDLAESVSPPDEMPNEFGDVEFVARDG